MNSPTPEYSTEERETIAQRIVLRALDLWDSPTTPEKDVQGRMSLAVYNELRSLKFEPDAANRIAEHTATVVLQKVAAAKAEGKSPREVVLEEAGLDLVNPWRDAYLGSPRKTDNPD